jgi:hypothetical protein
MHRRPGCSSYSCAGPNPRIDYVDASRGGLDAIQDEGVDLVYSIALAQHLTSEQLDSVLRACRRKLAEGGTLLIHLVVDSAGGWRRESEWTHDRSVPGRMRYRYGRHCFMRPADWYSDRLGRAGFRGFDLRPVGDYGGGHDDDICRQHVAIAHR